MESLCHYGLSYLLEDFRSRSIFHSIIHGRDDQRLQNSMKNLGILLLLWKHHMFSESIQQNGDKPLEDFNSPAVLHTFSTEFCLGFISVQNYCINHVFRFMGVIEYYVTIYY